MRTRIIIADNNDHYRTALALVLEAAKMEVVEQVSTGREAVEETFNNDPDILLLDIAMPDIDGLATLATIKYLSPKTKIIVSTSLTDPNVQSHTLDLGADMFMKKTIDNETLINTIRAMASEVVRVENPATTVKFTNTGQLKDHPNAPNFTPREIRILFYLAHGQGNKTILDRLSISANTLKSHMRKIVTKLECTNRTQATLWAIRNGLNELECSQVA